MNLYFWQNCISPHQLPYIKALCELEEVNEVFLISPVWDLQERKMMGWEQNLHSEKINILISPNKDKIEELFSDNQHNSVHFFSGIHADKSVYEYFKVSLNYNIKRGIITEAPFTYHKPLILHKIRFLLYDYKYLSKIRYVFAIGDGAVKYYRSWSDKWRVFPFGYSVEYPLQALPDREDSALRFLFVGSLIKRKNVSLLTKAAYKVKNKIDFSLDIIGDGPERVKLEENINKFSLREKCNFLGTLTMSEIHKKLSEYDVLILPSLHDGWGAVVNEGLQSGLFIIASDNCGAKTLIEDSNRGIVFKNNSIDSLTKAFNYCFKNSNSIKAEKQERIEWSKKINGASFAKYVVDCLLTDKYVLPPWKR